MKLRSVKKPKFKYVHKFEDDEPEVSKAVKKPKKPSGFFDRSRYKKKSSGFKLRPKVRRHRKFMSLEELYDDVDYAVTVRTGRGCIGRVIPGYRLKNNWKKINVSADLPTLPGSKIHRYLAEQESTWIEVLLPPNKKGLVLQATIGPLP